LHLDPESVVVLHANVRDLRHGQDALGPQQRRCLRVPESRVDPVERREGDDAIEAAVEARLLELPVDDLGSRERRQLCAAERCERSAKLDRDDLEAPFGQRERRLARARADLENPPTRSNHQRKIDEELVGVGRSPAVVERRDRLESLAQLLAPAICIRGHADIPSERAGRVTSSGRLRGG
jgi:hypothetical protein